MTNEQKKYDVFISYAREDAPWVQEHLYSQLRRCVLSDGRRPVIFLDTSTEGVKQGSSFITSLSEAILDSEKYVAIYSTTYFQKEMCQWELNRFFLLDPNGKQMKLNPILIEPEAEALIPFEVCHIQYVTLSQTDWFERLMSSLNLVPEPQLPQTHLAFARQPGDVPINHTISGLEVTVTDETGKHGPDVDIAVALERGYLGGTCTALTRQGVATFNDLFVPERAESVRLVAYAEGHEPVLSEPFSVYVPAPAPAPVVASADTATAPVGPLIDDQGDIIFHGDGSALVVMGESYIRCHGIDGMVRGELKLGTQPQIRQVCRNEALLCFSTWAGEILAIAPDGRCRAVSMPTRQVEGFSVPGGVALAGEFVYVGMWNGDIFRLSLTEDPVLVAQHSAGVQALAVAGEQLIVADLESRLVIYVSGEARFQRELGSLVLWLKTYPSCVVAIGEDRLYQFAFTRGTLMDESLRLGRVTDAFTDVDLPVLLDGEGKGLRFDADLGVRVRFSTTAGSKPISADDAGQYCVFLQPDGTHSLMIDSRIVYSHTDGGFAVSADGQRFAVGNSDGIDLLEVSALNEMMERSAS